MQSGSGVGIAIAFTAGLLSFLSPCVLPLVPSYVTFITGLSVEDVTKARRAALVHSLLFILGFTIIFMLLGAGATTIDTPEVPNKPLSPPMKIRTPSDCSASSSNTACSYSARPWSRFSVAMERLRRTSMSRRRWASASP